MVGLPSFLSYSSDIMVETYSHKELNLSPNPPELSLYAC